MNTADIELFKNRIAALQAKARRTNKPVKFCAGSYFATGRDGDLWEISSRDSEGERHCWDVKKLDENNQPTNTYLDPAPTLRQALAWIGNQED